MTEPADPFPMLVAAPHPIQAHGDGEQVQSMAMLTLDPQGRITSCCQSAQQLLGYGAHPITQCHFPQLFPEAGIRQGVPDQILISARHQGRLQVQTWLVRQGSYFWGTIGVTALWDAQALLQGFAVVITEGGEPQSSHLLHLEKIPQEHPSPYRELIHSLDCIFWEAEAISGRYAFVSPWAERVLGYPISQWLADPSFWIDHVHADDQERVQEARAWWVSACLNGGGRPFQEFEYRMITAEGQSLWIREKLTVIPEADPPRLRGMMMDITRSKLQEQERSRAEELIRQQSRREQALFEISQRIRQDLDLDSVLNTTVREVQTILETDRVVILQFDPEAWAGVVRVEQVNPGWSSLLQAQIHDPCFAQGYAERYRQGQVQVISDVDTARISPCYRDLLAGFQIRAHLVVPIRVEQQLWGLLCAHQCRAPRSWQIQDSQLLEQLAVQVGIAIRQAQLYHQVQILNHALEHQVQERTQQLQHSLDAAQVLHRITEQIRQTLDEHQILTTATRELGQSLGVEYCCVSFYDLDQQQSQVRYEYCSPDHPSNLGQILAMDRFHRVYDRLLQGQPYLSLSSHADLGDQLCLRASRRPGTTLICPMIVQEWQGDTEREILGDIGIFTSKQRQFESSEIDLFQQVADQCAIAIRQARLYQAAQRQVSELERLSQLKDDFLSTVSHELRTPMSNIKMAAFMLKQASLESRYLSYLQILEQECAREIALINDLLDLQRLDTQVAPLAITSVDLKTLIETLVQGCQVQAEHRQQQIEMDLAPDLSSLSTDPGPLEAILAELIQNACKYAPPNSQIRIQITQKRQDQVQVQVSNEGQIPPTEQERIFERFYRIPNADPWKQGGTGLGLALVKKRVEQLQGTIELVPHAHQVIFRCLLPCLPPPDLGSQT